MEGVSNGGMLYHEVQEAKLCAVHCVNTVLQGPFFSEFDLAALASDLDSRERQMMIQGGNAFTGDFLSAESHNVSLDGDFSIQVLQKALEVWDLQVIALDSPVAEPAQTSPEQENAFICHLHDHWFCIRKVNDEWYNFDSLYAAPQHLSKFYLAAYLDSLKSSGWSIFLVRGNFPKEFPIASSEASNGYGQWLSPDDAERITKSCNSTVQAPQVIKSVQPQDLDAYDEIISELEESDLNAAIAASLMESSGAPVTLMESSRAPVTLMESSQAPASLMESSQAPASLMESSQAPASLMELSQAPASLMEPSQTPAALMESSRAPATLMESSGAPAALMESSGAPTALMGSSEAPATLMESCQAPATLMESCQAPATVESSMSQDDNEGNKGKTA